MALEDPTLFEQAAPLERDRIRAGGLKRRERRPATTETMDAAESGAPYEIGWAKGDSPRTIWGLSHAHLANSIEQFSKNSGNDAHESLQQEATAAWTGFAWLVELGQRLEVTLPLATACGKFMSGIAQSDSDLAMHGYSAAEMIVSRLREQFGEDLGRSWNLQPIDEEFNQVVQASAILVERLMHEDPTETDTANSYELAVKISRGWARLVLGSYFLGFSAPYSDAAASIVSGMRDHCPEEIGAGARKMAAMAERLSQVSTTLVAGAQPRKGESVEFANGVPGGRYLATSDGNTVEGHPPLWSVEVVLSDPREG